MGCLDAARPLRSRLDAITARDASQFLETPWYGSRQMARHLRREGYAVGRKRVRRLMARMGLAPIYQRPRTTIAHPEHRFFPYLLRDVAIDRPNQVWCADITYLPMRRGFLYPVAVMDWATRKVLSWRVSNTLDVEFCLEALEEALRGLGGRRSSTPTRAASSARAEQGLKSLSEWRSLRTLRVGRFGQQGSMP